MTDRERGWASLLAVAAALVAVVVLAEVGLRQIGRPAPLREVEDAVAEYEDADPTVLAIGSSHARSFVAIGEELARRTGGRERVLAVPVEWGKLKPYAWVLENRLLPLIDERDGAGRLVRPSLGRLVVVTEWWDSTPPVEGQLPPNLPSRAWTFRHFLDDVLARGYDTYNANYVTNRWLSLWKHATLVQYRFDPALRERMRARLRPRPEAWLTRDVERRGEQWRRMVEGGVEDVGDPEQIEALHRMLDAAEARGLEVTLLLYPRMPLTITEQAKATTLARYASLIADIAARRGAHFVDWSTSSPLTDAHFSRDFDHVTPEGNRLLATWGLDGDLAFLQQPPAGTALARRSAP